MSLESRSLPQSARDPQEFDEAMAKASNEMLARWVLKNMGSRRQENVEFLAAIFAEHRRQCAASETRPALPKAPGVSRDRSAPSPGAILVFFERDLTDDELRDFHDWLNGRYPSTPDTTLVNAPGHRAPGMRKKQ